MLKTQMTVEMWPPPFHTAELSETEEARFM